MCNECYGRGIKHHFDIDSGIATVGPCKCSKNKPKGNWRLELAHKIMEVQGLSEVEAREYVGI